MYEIDEFAHTIKVQKGDTTMDAMGKLIVLGNATMEFGGVAQAMVAGFRFDGGEDFELFA